jgi:hypothetical protein
MAPAFPPTRLSVVARTRSDDEETRRVAFATMVEAYWKPVYRYLRLNWRLEPDAASDATQDFFVTVLEKGLIERFDPGRARFRTYLRLCLDGFAANQRKAEHRLKRGGGVLVVPLDFTTAEGELAHIEPAVPANVDELFYREWVREIFEWAVAELRSQSRARGREVMFEVFASYELVDDAEERPSYAAIALRLNLTPAVVTNHLAAMRREFRRIVLDRLREVTGSDEEWEVEARKLLGGHW